MSKEKFAFIDIETGSKTDISEGVDRYFADPSAHIIVICVKMPGEETHRTIENFDRARKIKLPKWLTDFKGTFVAHNWSFEFSAFRHMAPSTRLADPANWLCTMALAHRFNLPGSLGPCAEALKLKTQKSADGKRLIQEYSLPNKKTGGFNEITDADKVAWADYCADDVYASEAIFNLLFPLWGESERAVFAIDRDINARGINIDVRGARSIQAAFAKFIEKTEAEAERLAGRTEGGALAINSPAAFREFCEARGVKLPDARAETVENLRQSLVALKNGGLGTLGAPTLEVLKACEIRDILAARAVGKTDALLKGVSADGRYRFGQIYHVAHTGRWQSWGANFYNFPRESVDPKEWAATLRSVERAPTLDKFVSLQRGLIAAPAGETFVISDYAGIENRVLLWLAKDSAQLERIAAGESPYLIFAEKLYGEKITKADTKRYTLAKSAVLGLGYHQGAARFADFAHVSPDEADRTVRVWRDTHRGVVGLWKDFDRAFRNAIGGGEATVAGIKFYKRKATVCVELLSGRALYYRGAQLRPSAKKGREGEPEICALFGKSDVLTAVHGGILTENIVQALSRDLLVNSLVGLAGVKAVRPVLHVYDEIVCEVKKATAKRDAATIAKIMTDGPAWSNGLPLAVEQKICDRWTK